jgi:hypothetical protein
VAAEIRRVGQSYFVQTPNGDFPLETHSFVGMPLYNHIPWQGARRLVCKLFGAKYDYVCSVRYLTEARLQSMFPKATIAHERVCGLVKSFYIYHAQALPEGPGTSSLPAEPRGITERTPQPGRGTSVQDSKQTENL